MIQFRKPLHLTLALLALAALTTRTHATDVVVTIENLQPADGFFFTPVWLGMHDGSFDLFDSGTAASMELETIAETGDAGPLGTLFSSATNGDGTDRIGTVVTSPGGFAGAPVFDPGESVSTTISVDNPASNRYLSFASMIIPSNDAFVGNGDPMAYEIFTADGSFAGPLTIDLTSSSVYDSGTEVNDAMGAAFSAIGGMETDEMGTVGLHPGLDNFLGTETAAGTTIGSAIGASPVARITIAAVPEPASLSLLLLAIPALLRRVRR